MSMAKVISAFAIGNKRMSRNAFPHAEEYPSARAAQIAEHVKVRS